MLPDRQAPSLQPCTEPGDARECPPPLDATRALARLPAVSGAYLLLLFLAEPRTLSVGRLGELAFAAGWHVYAGSAHGPGGLRGRLRHHLNPVTRPHWHVDYLRAVAPCVEIWYATSDESLECKWAAALAQQPGAQRVPAHFGASDCGCAGHLVSFAHKPAPAACAAQMGCESEYFCRIVTGAT